MKKITTLFFLFFALTSDAQQINDYTQLINFEKKSHAGLLSPKVSAVPDNYDLKYHRFHWYVDPAAYQISGAVFSQFVVKTPTLSQVLFDLDSAMIVDSASTIPRA